MESETWEWAYINKVTFTDKVTRDMEIFEKQIVLAFYFNIWYIQQ